MRPPASTIRAALWLWALGFGLCACPSEVEHRYGQREPATPVEVDQTDPRVVKDGDDLYPAAVIERAQARAPDPDPIPGRGSGKPDESNGVCRLFAPKLPAPQCCELEYGFDVATVRDACGHGVYLGESWYATCGYYFHLADGTPTWFRASFINEDTAKAAADAQAALLRTRMKVADATISPVPGTKDAYWVTHEDLGWAYFGGWPKVRQLAWHRSACDAEGLAEVIAQMERAVPPPEGAERQGLIPTARTETGS
jgi:hypothetical protein